MFERYNDKARRVIFYARYFASELGGRYIEPEHVLLAILREDPDVVRPAVKTDEAMELLRLEVEAQAKRPERSPYSVDMSLSHSSKRVLAYAAEESERHKEGVIRPAHLLAGLLREQDGPAAILLRKNGIELQQTSLVFVASSQGPSGVGAEVGDVHRLIDELPPSQLGRARALLQALREASRSSE